jgi:hypothetical protein
MFIKFYLNFQIGDDITSDIALDEITFRKTPCDQTTSETVPLETTTSYPTSSFDCNFECNCICEWQYDTTGQYNWTLNKGSTLNDLTGPSSDHTTQSEDGYYLYLEGVLADPQTKLSGRIISPVSEITANGGCLKFFYHMYGADVDTLNVYFIEANSNDNGKPVWQKYGNKGDKWLFGHVYIQVTSSEVDYKFVIEGNVCNFFFMRCVFQILIMILSFKNPVKFSF